MLKRKKVELTYNEQKIILYALIDFRNELLKENKYADVVNEAIGKLKSKMKADRYVIGVIINALNSKREKEVAEKQDTSTLDYLILKLLNIYETLK